MQNCNCHPNPSADAGLVLAMATVPMQPWESIYNPEKALKQGTIFPNLDKPFFITAGGSATGRSAAGGSAAGGSGTGQKGGALHG